MWQYSIAFRQLCLGYGVHFLFFNIDMITSNNSHLRGMTWENILGICQIYHWRRKPNGMLVKCVFHRERTPSLRLYENSGRYKCYGCGADGTKDHFLSYHKTGYYFEEDDPSHPLYRNYQEKHGSYLDKDTQLLFPFFYQCLNDEEGPYYPTPSWSNR
jgi:hypothetical protein